MPIKTQGTCIMKFYLQNQKFLFDKRNLKMASAKLGQVCLSYNVSARSLKIPRYLRHLVKSLQWRHNERDGVSNHQPHSIVYSGADQRKHQSSASLAFVQGIHRRPVNYPHKGPLRRKMLPFHSTRMMATSCRHHLCWMMSPNQRNHIRSH